jgi:CTP:phosphocholine cytidylyltransferase-like protein
MSGLSKIQFDIMDYFYEKGEMMSPDRIASDLHRNSDDIKRVLEDLEIRGFLQNNTITAAGYAALEPYRAKRAVFVAAGFGTRLVPVTLNTPKPLVRVHGKRIIDGLIDAVLAAGIEEIYIVRGYLAEQFDQLLYKYPMIRFIENPAYNETNNISSALCARYLFSNAYLFEADLLLRKPELIKKYQYCSNFLGFHKERSDDWCFTMKDGYIATHKIGGVDCYQEYGISYWDAESGRKLASDLKEAYEMPGGKELFWTQIPTTVFHDNYKIEVRECSEGDIIEIDTFKELKKLDKSYDV